MSIIDEFANIRKYLVANRRTFTFEGRIYARVSPDDVYAMTRWLNKETESRRKKLHHNPDFTKNYDAAHVPYTEVIERLSDEPRLYDDDETLVEFWRAATRRVIFLDSVNDWKSKGDRWREAVGESFLKLPETLQDAAVWTAQKAKKIVEAAPEFMEGAIALGVLLVAGMFLLGRRK